MVYRIIILPVVLYECETWSLPRREEHKLRVFENRFLRGMLSSTGMDLIGGLIKSQNEFHDFYSPNIIRILKSRGML
jgi:hypothetical protein